MPSFFAAPDGDIRLLKYVRAPLPYTDPCPRITNVVVGCERQTDALLKDKAEAAAFAAAMPVEDMSNDDAEELFTALFCPKIEDDDLGEPL